eukprot:m.43009 g.43009  ORF g.43009 m.43009 type:complete len:136 (+) comp10754_c0_seq2:1058-1465(+)
MPRLNMQMHAVLASIDTYVRDALPCIRITCMLHLCFGCVFLPRTSIPKPVYDTNNACLVDIVCVLRAPTLVDVYCCCTPANKPSIFRPCSKAWQRQSEWMHLDLALALLEEACLGIQARLVRVPTCKTQRVAPLL